MIRAKLFKGLMDGTMNVGSLLDEEREKLASNRCCVYCGTSDRLSLDHLVPVSLGGSDSPENIVYACRRCNSSKGGQDLLAWSFRHDRFPPLMVLRRYLKLAFVAAEAAQLLEVDVEDPRCEDLPFRLDLMPCHAIPLTGVVIRNLSVE
jgi:hypothetical protein